MKFALRTGLMLLCGERRLELSRLLNGGDVQLEDLQTGRPKVMSEGELIRQIWSGRMKVISGSGAEAGSGGTSTPELPVVDLSSVRPDWSRQIEYRLRYLKGVQAAHASHGQRNRITAVIKTVALAINDPSPPSSSSLMEWARRWRKAEGNPLALLDKNKARVTPRRIHKRVDELITQVLQREYLTRKRHSLRHAHDCLTRELKLAVFNNELAPEEAKVSLATLSRRLKDIDAYQRVASREGDGRARMVMRTTMDGGGAHYPLQRVEVDHTPLNWVVICDDTGLPLGRPWLTAAIDAYSGYVVGLYLSFFAPNVSSVLGVLRNAVMPKDEINQKMGVSIPWLSHGLADEWVLDNGMEFHAQALQRVMWGLGVNSTFCRVRTPWLKPHVERFFLELNYLTIGSGRIHKAVANVVNLNPYKDATISFGNLVQGLTMFATEVHALQINQRKLARPLDLFKEGLERCPPAIYPGSWDEFRLISGMSKHLTVGSGGLELHGIPYGSAELLPWRKELGPRFKTLCKWDPDDMGQLYVQHPQRLTEWVTCPSRWGEYSHGLSFNQHLMIRKFSREQLRQKGAEEDLWAARMRLHDHWCDASRAKDRKSSLHAARAAGLTSAGMYFQKASEKAQLQAIPAVEQIVLPSPQLSVQSTPIPDFESFELWDAQ